MLNFETEKSLRYNGWGFSSKIFIITFALSMVASFLLPGWLGAKQWLMSPDYWWTVNSAQWVSHLAMGTVYQANPYYSALPGFLLLLAPVVAIGDHFGLRTAYAVALPYPSMWLLVGPVCFAIGSTFVFGVDYLCETLSVSQFRRRAILAISSPLIGVVTLVIGGHPEDLLALGLACLAFGFLLRGNVPAGAWVLAVAILMQTWAGLLLPTFIMVCPVGRRVSTAIRAIGPPAALGGLLLALDFRHASMDLLEQPMVNMGQHLPWWNLAPSISITGYSRHPLLAIAGSSSRFGAVLLAVVLGILVSHSKKPELVVGAGALSLAARGIFETEFWPYYLAPAALFMMVYAATSTSRKRWLAAFVLAIEFYLTAPTAYLGFSYSSWFALALLVSTSLGSFTLAVEGDFTKLKVISLKKAFLEASIVEAWRKSPRGELPGDTFLDLE